MNPPTTTTDPDNPNLPSIKIHHPTSPRHHHHPSSTATPTSSARRKLGIAVDLSDESAFAVHWAVHNYIRPGDAVILVHVSPTSILLGADWGPVPLPLPTSPIDNNDDATKQKMEDDFEAFTASKAGDLAKPLKDANIPYKIHIVKDHDMKERLCLEVERLGLSTLIMGSRGFGAVKRGSDGRLGSVSDYCVHHCACPVVVVRRDKDAGNGGEESKPVVKVNVPGHEEEEEVKIKDA